MEDIISKIVAPEYVDSWVGLNPDIYYKNGKPYGMMTVMELDGILYVASTVNHNDNPFTVDMLKRIRKLYNERKICLLTDVVEKQPMIRKALSRYKFRYEYDHLGVMYSYNTNHDEG